MATPAPATIHDFARLYTAAWCSQNAASVAAFFSPSDSLRVNAAGRSTFVESPRLEGEGELPLVRITLPDGTSVLSDSGDVDRVLSGFFRRQVRLARARPSSPR